MSNKVEILQKIEQYRSMHPQLSKLSEEQIISVMINDGVLTLSEAEKISVFGEQNKSDLGDSVSLRQSAYQQGKPVVVQLSDGKSYDLNQTIMNRINMVSTNLKKAEESNGFIGSAWSWVKNTTGIGDSSDDVREAQEKEKKLLQQFNNEKKRPEIFKELTGVDYTPENLEKFIKGEIKLKSEQALSGYEEGQEMATDVGADIVSGITAVGIYTASVAAAPFTGGASIAVGVAAAAASGAAIKTGLKAADAAAGGREYTLDDAKHDAVTGGFSGVLAPVTGGMGGAVGKTVATKFGIQVIKQTGKSAAQQTAKSGIKKSVETALLNPTGYEYIGGNAVKRAAAQAAEMATDGAIGGAVDNAFRTAYDGGGAEEVLQAAAEGFVGGAIMSPVIGGGMKSVGVAFNRIKGIDEFSSLVTNCKNLSDDDLLNLYQYYKNYEKECIANNKPVPDMKQAGFDKLMEEINARGLNVDGQTLPPTSLPGVNETAHLEAGVPSGKSAGGNETAQSEAGTLSRSQAGERANKTRYKMEDNCNYEYKIGILSLTDNSGNTVGLVNYDIREINGQKVLHFEGLKSELAGQGIGTTLIENLVQKSKELGADGRLVATASPELSVTGKKTNLEFYYKLGFRAADETKHKQILECIEQGKEIPIVLNLWTDIYMTPEGVNKILSKNMNSGEQVLGEMPAEEVAPFAKHLEQSPDIQDLTKPEIKRIQFENGEFDADGNFVPDGTYTVTESGNPLAKSQTFKHYPDGDLRVATNMKELTEQVKEIIGRDKLNDYELRNIKELVERNSDLSIADLSEVINDFCHVSKVAKGSDSSRLFSSYDGLLRIENMKNFKANISQFDKFITEMQKDGNYTEIVDKLRNMRLDFFTDDMANIKPEDFKANLELFKTLDPDFQSQLIHYDYDVILKSHGDKFFERIKIADDFNKFMKKAPIRYDLKAFIGREAKCFEKYSDEQFAQVLKNIELVKDLTNAKCENSRMLGDILSARGAYYTDLAERMKKELGDIFDYDYFVRVWNSYGAYDSSIAIIKAFPEDAKALSSWNLQDLGSHYYNLDEAGKKNFMDKLNIASKMPHLASYQDKLHPDLFVRYMKEREITNADKISEFVSLAEPEFLRKIDFAGYGNRPILDFEQVFESANLDNMIENAKLHKELSQNFKDYLKSENSLIGKNRWSSEDAVNYQYSIPHAELVQRVNQIKKFEDKYEPDVLEHIYNGSCKVSDEALEALSTIDKSLLKKLISYRHTEKIAAFDKETLEKFTNYIRNAKLTEDDIQNFCYNFNPEVFVNLSAEELDAISFKELARHRELDSYTLKALKEGISTAPKKVRDLIKEDVTLAFYVNKRYSYEEIYKQKLNYLNSLTLEDLQAIGSKSVLEYFDRDFDELVEFNPVNLEIWKSVPQDIRDKFEEFGYYVLKDEKPLDIDLFKARIKNLKDKNVFEYIEGGPLSYITRKASPEIEQMMNDVISDSGFKPDNINYIINSLKQYDGEDAAELAFLKELIRNPKLNPQTLPQIFNSLYRAGANREQQKEFARYLLKRDDFDPALLSSFLNIPDIQVSLLKFNELKIAFAKELLDNPNIKNEDILAIMRCQNMRDEEIFPQMKSLILDMIYFKYNIGDILNVLNNVTDENALFARGLVANKDFPQELIAEVIRAVRADNIAFAQELVANKDFPQELMASVIFNVRADNIAFAQELVANKNIPRELISNILQITDNAAKQDFARNLCKNYKQMEIPIDKIYFLIENYGNISPKDLQKLSRLMGRDKVAKLSDSDMIIACQMVDIYGKTSINEIPMEGKQNLLRKLVGCNTGLFTVSDEVKKAFPLIPTDRETYCSLLPSIVKSLGVDIRTIEPPSRIKEFNNNLETLSTSVAKLSDSDFASLDIKLTYPKDKFISDVLKKVKDLSPNERQKVYDYFGFELHHNKNNPTGFSITGYPVNLNNGKKLAEITDSNTKAVVESLRPDVVKFSEQNPIKCNNPAVQNLLNDVVDVLPELRAQIGKVQHKTHDFDVFKHSLKVMQKVAQEPNFKNLNESDKKIMMLASLLHDITKGEGYADKTHAAQGSFDTFFISKKFNLTPDEEIKLYTLTRHHEWLEYVNTAKSEEQLTKRLQSVAYDLQHDNLFDMALMFTHADLKAVKVNDMFHDSTAGRSRVDFNGNVRSFGESANVYAERIKGYIAELKKSQPILPVTKIPKSDKINAAITKVNPDGSTNIKGVYKRDDGLVVIKFNEVEDWETIGFAKGSVSRSYTAQAGSKASDGNFNENINTGNIKFFVHGLDYENQLAKFDAFSLIDSDVLLSVSYAERPESKFRFFRAQGVLLDIDTKYIHGGGNTDSGSGCGKFIEDFKRNYIFGGYRESDRVYVSNLIKNATGMNDANYVKFVEVNKNRALSEIEPAEYREPIIKALAAINSNTRKGGRSYNEMYGSNPKEVMGVFAYDKNTPSDVGNPLTFLSMHSHTEFLQRYALEHNIPFVIFGD